MESDTYVIGIRDMMESDTFVIGISDMMDTRIVEQLTVEQRWINEAKRLS